MSKKIECVGLLGKIFGHKYVTFEIEKIPKITEIMSHGYNIKSDNTFLDKTCHIKKLALCKRCGSCPDEQTNC